MTDPKPEHHIGGTQWNAQTDPKPEPSEFGKYRGLCEKAREIIAILSFYCRHSEHNQAAFMGKLVHAIADLEARLEAANEEIRGYDELMLLQRTRMGMAEQMWRDAHNQPDTYPDLGKLIEWLVERLAAAERSRDLWKARAAIQTRERDEARAGLRDVQALIDESQGVYGLHLNGEGAPWDTLLEGGHFEAWLLRFSQAMSRLATETEGGG